MHQYFKDYLCLLLYEVYIVTVYIYRSLQPPYWCIKVSIAAQKFATSCITDCKGSDTTRELRMDIPWNALGDFLWPIT